MKKSSLGTMYKKKYAFGLILITLYSSSFCQSKSDLNDSERAYHNTIEHLCQYLVTHDQNIGVRDSIIQKYVLFDYVLNDTSQARIKRRISAIDSLLRNFKHFLDSVGVSNLDARPIRFYENDSVFYHPFVEDIKDGVSQTLAYYDKRRPKNPYGYLLFDKKTKKLISWIMIDQGGYHYFLTFNLI